MIISAAFLFRILLSFLKNSMVIRFLSVMYFFFLVKNVEEDQILLNRIFAEF